MLDAEKLKRLLRLEPLPVEGGWFRQTWRADEEIARAALPARYAGARPMGTAIYYLLTAEPECFSALHRLLTDEVYHFYLGDPVELLLLHPGGRGEPVVLGPELEHGHAVQYTVPRGVWQGSRLRAGGRFALLGTTMAPAFDPADFTLGRREELVAEYPALAEAIRSLTRE